MTLNHDRTMSSSSLLRRLAALIVGAVLMASCSSDDEPAALIPDGPESETPGSTTTSGVPVPALQGLLADAAAYFAAYESGDSDAVMALFPEEAAYVDNFGDSSRGDFEILTAWDMAQVTVKVEPDCTGVEESGEVRVSCVHGDHQYLARAVGAPPVEVTLTLTATDDAITEVSWIFGQPGYLPVQIPFDNWMAENHPEDLRATIIGGDSVEEARQNAQMRVQNADQWAADLSANDCTYNEECTP